MLTSAMKLNELGWQPAFSQAFDEQAEPGLVPARVARQNRHHYVVFAEAGALAAEVSGGMREAAHADLVQQHVDQRARHQRLEDTQRHIGQVRQNGAAPEEAAHGGPGDDRHEAPGRLPAQRGTQQQEEQQADGDPMQHHGEAQGSVVVVGIAVAAYAFVGPFDAGYQAMKSDAELVFQGAQESGSGEQR